MAVVDRYLAVRNRLMKEIGRTLTTVEKAQVKAQLVQIAAMEVKAAYERKKKLLDDAHQFARRSRRVSLKTCTAVACVQYRQLVSSLLPSSFGSSSFRGLVTCGRHVNNSAFTLGTLFETLIRVFLCARTCACRCECRVTL